MFQNVYRVALTYETLFGFQRRTVVLHADAQSGTEALCRAAIAFRSQHPHAHIVERQLLVSHRKP